MKRWEDVTVDISPEDKEKIDKLAEELNMTFNEFCCEALKNYIFENSEKVTTSQYGKLLQDYEDSLNKGEFLKEYYTIIDDFAKPIARVTPILD